MLEIPAENCLRLTYQLLPPAMHLAQQLRKESNGEQLIGLIDGVAAIVLTLLVIEMPIIIIQAIEHAEGKNQLYLSIGMDVMGYFLISVSYTHLTLPTKRIV